MPIHLPFSNYGNAQFWSRVLNFSALFSALPRDSSCTQKLILHIRMQGIQLNWEVPWMVADTVLDGLALSLHILL